MGNCTGSKTNKPSLKEELPINQLFQNYQQQVSESEFLIKSYTWHRQSHGLFDYESKQVTKSQKVINCEGRLIRNRREVEYIQQQIRSKTQASDKQMDIQQDLLQIKEMPIQMQIEHKCKFELIQTNPLQKSSEHPSQKELSTNNFGLDKMSLWVIVKSIQQYESQKDSSINNLNNNKFSNRLQAGDVIKLGRMRFRVRELRSDTLHQEVQMNSPVLKQQSPSQSNIINKLADKTSSNKCIKQDDNKTQIPLEDSSENEALSPNHVKQQKEGRSLVTCRICLMEEELNNNCINDNPLISPCDCIGSVKFVHLQCLQRWLQSKVVVKQSIMATQIIWKNLDCELCKKQYNNFVWTNEHNLSIIDIKKPSNNYMILEILSRESNQCKGLSVISFESKDSLCMGRGASCEVRLADISVSRKHAFIKLSADDKQFRIIDNDSKFGTLLLAQDNLKLNEAMHDLAVQVGRTICIFLTKTSKQLKSQCLKIPSFEKSLDEKEDYVNEQNDSHVMQESFLPEENELQDDGVVLNQLHQVNLNHNNVEDYNINGNMDGIEEMRMLFMSYPSHLLRQNMELHLQRMRTGYVMPQNMILQNNHLLQLESQQQMNNNNHSQLAAIQGGALNQAIIQQGEEDDANIQSDQIDDERPDINQQQLQCNFVQQSNCFKK